VHSRRYGEAASRLFSYGRRKGGATGGSLVAYLPDYPGNMLIEHPHTRPNQCTVYRVCYASWTEDAANAVTGEQVSGAPQGDIRITLSCQAPSFSFVDKGLRACFLRISKGRRFAVIECFTRVTDDEGLEAEESLRSKLHDLQQLALDKSFKLRCIVAPTAHAAPDFVDDDVDNRNAVR